jgi:hypothetical protein
LSEKWQVNLACGSDFHVNRMPQICDMGQTALLSLSKEGMLWTFSPEKSDGFGRVRTRDLGYQRPAC